MIALQQRVDDLIQKNLELEIYVQELEFAEDGYKARGTEEKLHKTIKRLRKDLVELRKQNKKQLTTINGLISVLKVHANTCNRAVHASIYLANTTMEEYVKEEK